MPDRLATEPIAPDATPTWREQAGARRTRRARVLGRVVRRLLTGASAILLSVGAGALAWSTIGGDAASARRQTLSRIGRSLAQTYAASATPAVAAGDKRRLDAACESILAGKLVAAVGFTDAAGRTLTRAGPVVNAAGPRESITLRDASGAAVGTMWVAIDPAAVNVVEPGERAVIGVAVATAGTMAALSILVAAAYVRRRMAPLRRLARAARQVQAGAPNVGPADATQDDGDDGVTEVRAAIARLSSFVGTHRQELAAHEARAAAAIRDLEAKLDDRAKQLTAANERLVGEIAEKEDFVRAISHDLNAPLRNIGGMVTMMLGKHRAALPEDVVHKLERVKANVDIESSLIDELLEFSRIKTRRQSLAVVEVEKLVWELRGLFENDLKTRHIELVLETSLPNLFADRMRVRQIFQNLIDNAIKYMGDEQRRRAICIGCKLSVTEAEFYVRDTGIGINAADLDKVFHIFRRGTNEQAQKVAGKGVGLASVKSIIETYAGRIWVESEPGVGTTFRFTINGQYVPAVSGQLPQEMKGQAPQIAPTLSAGVGDNRAA